MQDIVVAMNEALQSPGTAEEKHVLSSWKILLNYNSSLRSWPVKCGSTWDNIKRSLIRHKALQHTTSQATFKGTPMFYCLKHTLIAVDILLNFVWLIPGIAHEGYKEFDSALEVYLRAVDFLDCQEIPISYPSVQQWINKIAFRLCMLSLRLQEPLLTLSHFRRYRQLVTTRFKPALPTSERVAICRLYWKTLSNYIKTTSGKTKSTADEKGSCRYRISLNPGPFT